MRYVYELTVPADTAISTPAESEALLVIGTIKQVEIAFPPGCAGEVKVVLLDKILQISPANSDMYHAWDDYTEVFSMDYLMDDPAPKITLQGWSPGTVYSHKVTFRFDVVPKGMDEREVLIAAMGASFKPYG